MRTYRAWAVGGMLALALSLCGTARAQVYPNIPPSSVLGRLGGSQSGPPQAISFTALAAQLDLNATIAIGTPITGGTSQGLLFVQGSQLGNLPAPSGGLVQYVGGVPQISLALPAAASWPLMGLLIGNGSSPVTAYAGQTCTNQFITALSTAGAATCNSVTNAYLTSGSFTNITGVGTLTAGTWNATLIGATYGGTGVNNGASTITLAAALTTTGAGAATLAFGSSSATYTFPSATATLAFYSGSFTNGHCLQISSGAIVDAGGACTTGGGGGTVTSATINQVAYYPSTGTTVAGSSSFTWNAGALTISPSGTAGSLTMGNATSGTLTLAAVTGALGTVTASFPANTGTVAEWNLNGPFTNGLNITGGNVAIGASASPGNQLYVSGANQTTASLTNGGNAGGEIMLFDTGAGAGNGGAVLFGASNGSGNNLAMGAIKGLLTNGTGPVGDIAIATRVNTTDTALTTQMFISPGLSGVGPFSLSSLPAGNWDVENGSDTASSCLNGVCTSYYTTIYKCTGTDTTALNTLISSGISSITISGTCGVTTLNQLPVDFTLRGSNRLTDILQTSSTTGNVVTLASSDTVENLGFASSVTRSSGDFIYAGDGGSGIGHGVTNITLRSLFLESFYNGIELHGVGTPAGSCPITSAPCSGVHATDLVMYGNSSPNDCILIDGQSGENQPYNTDITFDHVFCTGATSGSKVANGVEVQTGGDIDFSHLQVIYSTNGINLDPSGSQGSGNVIQYFACRGCLLDSGTNGLEAYATSGAAIETLIYENGWIASNSGYGVLIRTDSTTGSAVSATNIGNNTLGGNNYGVVMYDSSQTNATNIHDNIITDNATAGIYLGVSQSSFRIMNNKIGFGSGFPANGLSIQCSGSASPGDTIVMGNDMGGNSSSCAWTFSLRTGFNVNF